MEKFLDILSTREISFLSWIFFATIAMTLRTDIRNSMGGVLKALFAKNIISILLLMLLYFTGIIFFLWKIGFWKIYLFKDTIFWLFSFALVAFLNVNKAKDEGFFRSLLNECLKWTIFIEFLVNFYTFSLTAELIMFPIILFAGLGEAFSKTVKNNESARQLFSSTLSLIGTAYLIYALYKTIVDYASLFTTQNLLSLLLPIILTLTLLPFLYGLLLYMKYETLFIRIQFMTNDKEEIFKIKWAIYSAAKLSLSKLKTIEGGLKYIDLYDTKNIDEYFRHLILQRRLEKI